MTMRLWVRTPTPENYVMLIVSPSITRLRHLKDILTDLIFYLIKNILEGFFKSKRPLQLFKLDFGS